MLLMKSTTEKQPGQGELFVAPLPEMEPWQFEQWTTLLKQRTGMRLPDKRTSFLVTNLGMRMRTLGIEDFQTYYDYVTEGRNGMVEWGLLMHHLTVHETRFLRHESVLAMITQHCLPTSPADCPAEPLAIDVWSVGCSTGEEPYSVAMAIDDRMCQLGAPYFLGVMASDISRAALATGRKGSYSKLQVRAIGQHWMKKYFTETNDGRFQVVEALRNQVCFNHLNILQMGDAPIGKMDIILCQNLLIYFDREERIQIANTLADHLQPGGMLILGVGELLNWEHPQMKRFPYANTLAFQHQ